MKRKQQIDHEGRDDLRNQEGNGRFEETSGSSTEPGERKEQSQEISQDSRNHTKQQRVTDL